MTASETLTLPLRHQAEVDLRFAARFAGHRLIARVLHPALPEDPGNTLVRRDCLGASGVSSLILPPAVVTPIAPVLDAFMPFAIGASWGGTHSLVAPMPMRANRTATDWAGPDLVLRLSIGPDTRPSPMSGTPA